MGGAHLTARKMDLVQLENYEIVQSKIRTMNEDSHLNCAEEIVPQNAVVWIPLKRCCRGRDF
jgi:hypothetical protein